MEKPTIFGNVMRAASENNGLMSSQDLRSQDLGDKGDEEVHLTHNTCSLSLRYLLILKVYGMRGYQTKQKND